MKYRLLFVLAAVCVGSVVHADGGSDYARISFVGPGKGTVVVDRDQFVVLVVEGPYISCEKSRIPDEGLVDYVNTVLKTKGASYLAVYAREGVKYGEVVKAIDALRKTDAKDIGVSTVELAAGREP